MSKKLNHLFLSLILICPSSISLAISQYTVKSGNSLWVIATDTKPSRTTNTTTMIKSIKGLNLEDYPNIVNNIVKQGQTLTIPTSNQEIKDGLSIYQAHQTGGSLPATQTQTQTQAQVKPKDLAQNNTIGANLQHENQRLIQENHELRVAFKEYQENASSSVNALSHEIKTLQDSSGKSISWIITFILLMISLFLFLKNRKYRKTPDTKTSKNHENTKNKNNDNIEPTLFSDDSIHINVNEALVEAMIMLDEKDPQGAKICLQTALNDNPDNIDIRIKLLEVYGIENDLVSFNSEKDYLSAHLLSQDNQKWEEVEKIYSLYFIRDHK
ncbi:MAG: Tfp pilus assembly protein FimV [Francisellaceae bacterium]|jgi:Tfp pilus assembly protein FimV